MNKYRLLLCCLFPFALLACAFGYQAHGSLSDVPGELRGKAFPGNAAGGGRFELADRDGRLSCDGRMAPPRPASDPGSCQGEVGEGEVVCSDGRRIPVRWEAVTCRSFTGHGEDQSGNRLFFQVDRSR